MFYRPRCHRVASVLEASREVFGCSSKSAEVDVWYFLRLAGGARSYIRGGGFKSNFAVVHHKDDGKCDIISIEGGRQAAARAMLTTCARRARGRHKEACRPRHMILTASDSLLFTFFPFSYSFVVSTYRPFSVPPQTPTGHILFMMTIGSPGSR